MSKPMAVCAKHEQAHPADEDCPYCPKSKTAPWVNPRTFDGPLTVTVKLGDIVLEGFDPDESGDWALD